KRSSRDGSCLRRHRTLSVPLPPISQSIPPPPTSQVYLHHLHHLGRGALDVEGRLGELRRGSCLMDNNGMSPSFEDMAWALLQIFLRVAWSNMHERNLHRLELFKVGRCQDLADGSESWVDEESRRRYTMTQLMAPFSDVDAKSHTPATPKEAFISVMGKDRADRVRCADSGETLSTWYKSTTMSGSSEQEKIMQEQLKVQEEKLKAQAEEMTQIREKITRLENIATKVDEMSTLLSQI
ncbi:hypothetical protein Taro_043878, partial [Colocasia esculenta]|nr:hypothetical protein [Colocasia esculenta]